MVKMVGFETRHAVLMHGVECEATALGSTINFLRRSPEGFWSARPFHRKANLERHLEVADFAILDVTTGPHDLEPSQMPDGLMRPRWRT
jgi:hypothetical protein